MTDIRDDEIRVIGKSVEPKSAPAPKQEPEELLPTGISVIDNLKDMPIQNRYNADVVKFLQSVEAYVYDVHEQTVDDKTVYEIGKSKADGITYEIRYKWEDLRDKKEKQTILDNAIKPKYFSTNKNDLRAYNAFMDAYAEIIRYYKYEAKYNLENKNLENKLKDWYFAINQKPNIFVRFAHMYRHQK